MSEPSAWRTRWKNGSERDREWEMWTYRTEQPVPNDNQIIEALYAEPRSDRIEALENENRELRKRLGENDDDRRG